MLAKCNMNISILMHFKGRFVNVIARNYEQFVKTLTHYETFFSLKLSFIYLFAIIIKAEMLFTPIDKSKNDILLSVYGKTSIFPKSLGRNHVFLISVLIEKVGGS